MYVQHFGLEHEPFSIAPDPRYLYLGERHREALAHLLYGLGGGGGFVLLTGEVGAGKTTVCRCFLEQVPPHCQVAYVFNPKLTVTELLAVICDEFGIAVPDTGGSAPTVKSYVDPLNRFLLAAHAAGRNCVLLIDEAQQLAPDVLEQLRLLTNLETNERKLLQIILVGQPELRDMLAQPGLEQLAQRVIARYHLGPLSEADTALYLQHRLAVAGLRGASPLGPALVRRIHGLSGGVPRRINLLCDRALLGAYSQGRAEVDMKTLVQAAREVDGARPRPPRGAWHALLAPAGGRAAVAWVLGGVLLGSAALVASGWRPTHPDDRVAAAAGASASAGRAGGAAASGADGGAGPSQPGSVIGTGPGLQSDDAPPAVADAATLRRLLGALRSDEAEALRRLAARWGVALAGGEACPAAARQSLNCFRSLGGLAELRRLDRPAMLVLRTPAGAPLAVSLLALGPTQAWLQIGDERRAVALADLAGWWRGEFATLWRSLPGDELAGAPTSGSAAEAALARRLAAAKAPSAGASGAATATVRAQLVSFQIAQGLVPDGLPGPLTWMALNRAGGVPEPRLAVAS